MNAMDLMDPEYIKKKNFYEAIVITYSAAINFAHRYAAKAREMAASCPDPVRKAELLQIAANCDRVPERGATNFYEACQAFWFVQILLQIEANGHSISPGRFDQYMYPYLAMDKSISKEFAQELVDCIWDKIKRRKQDKRRDFRSGIRRLRSIPEPDCRRPDRGRTGCDKRSFLYVYGGSCPCKTSCSFLLHPCSSEYARTSSYTEHVR